MNTITNILLKSLSESVDEEEKLEDSFSGIVFEKMLPYNMRFKEYHIIDNHDLYWITQDAFEDNLEDIEKFIGEEE